MYTVNMRALIEVLFKQEVRVLETYRRFVEKVGSYVPILLTDYLQLLKNIDLNEFSTTDITDINGCVTYVSKLCDIFLLIASNTLTSLAVTVSSKFLDEYDISVDDILDTMVPPLKNQSLTCHKAINRKFNDIKYHYLNKNKFKITSKRSKVDSSSNLCLGTYNMLSRCSDIVEKSQIILKKIDEYPLRTLDEKKLLHKCISELSGEVGEYYESLSILQRLYEVDIGRALPVPTFPGGGSIEAPIESSKINEVVDASLNPTEPAADEEYELFISGMDDSDFEARDYSSFEEECRKYAAVLSRELKQKLKKDSRFRAAREKRGIIDEETENLKKNTSEAGGELKQEPIQCIVEPLLVPMQDSSPPPPPPLPPVEGVIYNSPTKPMPPPLPLQVPVPNVGPSGDVLQPSQTGTDFQHFIKLMADKRQIVEDVFECSEAEEKMD